MDNDAVIVYAEGPNEVVIPVAIFKTMEDAESILSKILHSEPKGKATKHWNLNILGKKIKNKEVTLTEELKKAIIDSDMYVADDLEDMLEEEGLSLELYLSATLFRGAYFGCGGPDVIIAKKVKFGQLRLFEYNLD